MKRFIAAVLVWCLLINTSVPTVQAVVVTGMIEGENVVHFGCAQQDRCGESVADKRRSDE